MRARPVKKPYQPACSLLITSNASIKQQLGVVHGEGEKRTPRTSSIFVLCLNYFVRLGLGVLEGVKRRGPSADVDQGLTTCNFACDGSGCEASTELRASGRQFGCNEVFLMMMWREEGDFSCVLFQMNCFRQ